MEKLFYDLDSINHTLLSQALALTYFAEGVASYSDDFLQPLFSASLIFAQAESDQFFQRSPQDNLNSYQKLLKFNVELFTRYCQGAWQTLSAYQKNDVKNFFEAYTSLLARGDCEKLSNYIDNNKEILERVVKKYPQAIKEIEPEYGFHFEKNPGSFIAETDRFILRKVFPSVDGVKTDDSLKPVLIIPPFVLGANILSFLPGSQKSYAHSFANRSIPTYIRIMKPIGETVAVQKLTLEDDAKDTKIFCEQLLKTHNSKVTLNGYCQGGFSSVCNLLSGQLDGLVDALITCVAPMDGTKSVGLGKFLNDLPEQFNNLQYGTKTLSSGIKVASGELMGWVYKLKSIEDSGPMVAFFNDIMMFTRGVDSSSNSTFTVNKTVAALNYWLQNERSDLPLSVTEMSFLSYNEPVSEDGTLPITMFGKKLNFKALRDKGIEWLLCYGESDDLVEKEVALAATKYVDVEVTPFPKGHVAMATSWSHPDSACALDSRFGPDGKLRGPVRFHLDLTQEKTK